ncbi:Ankyrin repeat-containing domain protein [Metarhizium brunneum]
MAVPLTFLVLVTGVAGDSALPDGGLDPQEVTRSFSTSLARLRLGLHQLGTPAHRSIPSDFARWATWEEYNDWASGTENPVLHIVGLPGTGTSLFATQVTSHLREGGNLVLSYSACHRTNPRNSTVSLWHSFCQQALLSPYSYRSTTPLCTWLRKEGIFTKDTFRGLLRSILSGCAGKATFCIINGLDHYTSEARDELLRDLGEMRTSSQGELKVLTVGSASHVQYGKPGYPLVVYLQERILAAGELERLAKTRIRSMAAVNPAWKTLDLESEQVKRLWAGSTTLFELCQKMDFLEKGETLSTTDEAIAMVATLPADFTVFFRTLATKYDFLHDGRLGAAVLPWLTRSVRPMTVPELAVCAALARTSTETLTLQHLQKSILWDFRRDLENELGPIIQISGETVEMRHRIYQDLVLADSNALGKGDVHLDILTTCLIYLRQIGPSWKHSTEFRQEHRLAEYAALHWPRHYHEVRDKATAKPVVLSLLQNEEQFTVWLDIYSHYATRSAEEESFPKTPIQVAAYLGLTEVLSELAANVHPSNKDTELTKAMEYAASKGHANVIRLLAELGVRAEGALLRASWLGDNATVTELLKTHRTYINSRGGPDGIYTPLLQAARCGHVDSFAKLQSEGADPNAVAAHTNLTALHLEARIGQRAIVQLLIAAKVPLASVDEQGYGALHYAAEGGFEEIVRCMIVAANDTATLADESRVSQVLLANDQTRDSNTPLHLAASNGHLKTVETLLEMKAGPSILNDRKYTPLHCAAEEGFPSVVKALLKVGTVAENQGEQSMVEVQRLPGEVARIPSPVELAAKNGHLCTVTELRSWRFYDNSEVLYPAFATACREGTNDCALYILQWYNEVSFAGGPLLDVDGNTALHLAARDGNVRLFQKLMNSKHAPIDSFNKKGLSPLHIAASSGSLAIIQLFKDDSALSGTTANGTERTLLHIAAEAGYFHVVEWLLDYTSLKKETATAVKDTAIMLAAVGKHEPIVKLLLDSKYAVPTGNLLHVAVVNSWKDVTKLLTSCDVSVLNWIDGTTGNAALHLAVVIKKPEMVEALLAVGADPNLGNKEGRLPISMAVETKNLDIVTALLDGAPTLDVDQIDMDGLTPLLRACKVAYESGHGTAKLVRELLSKRKADINLNAKCPCSDEKYAGMTPLHLSALILSEAEESSEDIIDEEDNIFSHAKSIDEEKNSDDEAKDEFREESDEPDDELLKLLLGFGADPNTRDATGSTPLVLAAEAGHVKALRALLDHNADPNISNTRETTALHLAAQSGHVASINLLVKKGANMDVAKVDETPNRGLCGITPLVLAVGLERLGAVKALLRLGADIGRAIHIAALFGELDIFKAVHRKRPDPNIFDSGLGTLLCLAVTADSMDIVSHLLENPKVATSMANPIGQMPLTIAAIMGNCDIAKCLVEKGADPDKRDHEGRTPLDYAILFADEELAKFLCQHTRLGFPLDGVRGHSPLYLACRMPNDDIFNEIHEGCQRLPSEEYLKLCELAIHAAIMSNNGGRLATLLTTPGVKATVADDDGWTPLQCDRSYDRKEMQAQILGAGATDESSGEMKTPTQWHLDDRHAALSPCIGAEQTPRVRDPKIVEVFARVGDVIELTCDPYGVAVARADHCIPDGQDFFFEIKVQKGCRDKYQTLGIGLCSDIAPLNSEPSFGHPAVSCGYYARNGEVRASGVQSTGLFKPRCYGEGDVVGCGVDAKKGTIYFTKAERGCRACFSPPFRKALSGGLRRHSSDWGTHISGENVDTVRYKRSRSGSRKYHQPPHGEAMQESDLEILEVQQSAGVKSQAKSYHETITVGPEVVSGFLTGIWYAIYQCGDRYTEDVDFERCEDPSKPNHDLERLALGSKRDGSNCRRSDCRGP